MHRSRRVIRLSVRIAFFATLWFVACRPRGFSFRLLRGVKLPEEEVHHAEDAFRAMASATVMPRSEAKRLLVISG
jgi:hypothetical protein